MGASSTRPQSETQTIRCHNQGSQSRIPQRMNKLQRANKRVPFGAWLASIKLLSAIGT